MNAFSEQAVEQAALNWLRSIGFGASGGFISSRMVALSAAIDWSWESIFSASSSNLCASSGFVANVSRSYTKARMIAKLIRIAQVLLSTEESIATPCSVRA